MSDNDPRFCPYCGSRLERYASAFSASANEYRRYKRCPGCGTTHVTKERRIPTRVNQTPTPR